MISTEHVKKSCLKVLVTYLGEFHVEAQQIVTMSNGSIDSLGGTSNEVFKKRNTSLGCNFLHKCIVPSSERRLFS